MKIAKIENRGAKILTILAIILIVSTIIIIGISMFFNVKIRKFNMELKVLMNETKACTLEYNNEKVEITDSQIAEVCIFPRKLYRVFEWKDREPVESITFSLLQRKEIIDIVIDKLDEETIKISIVRGDDIESFCFRVDGEYEKLKESLEL